VVSALHIYPSPFTHESRILKETRSLVESGLFDDIVVGAVWEEGLAEHEELDASRKVWRVRLRSRRLRGTFGKLLRFAEWYVRILLRFRRNPPDFISCHSLSGLPLGALFHVFLRSRIIYDTHELETETQSTVGIRRTLSKLVERALIRRAEAVIVVGESIAEWYRKTYDLVEVHVVRNIPTTTGTAPVKTDRLRRAFGLKDSAMLFICQGMVDEGRGIRIILDAFAEAPPDRHLVILGYGPLVSEVMQRASLHPNVHYHPAVPPGELLEYTAGADVGLSLIENTSLSYFYSLPNKMFEYILSGIPVVVSDFPDMAAVVDRLGCGWKSSVDAASVSTLVCSLSREDVAMRAGRALKSAASLSWRSEEMVLVSLYQRLLAAS